MARRTPMKTVKPKYDYKPYPTPQDFRTGIKVSWNYYDSEADAKECAKAAQHNADIQAAQGYDFGYQSPGSIRKMGDTGEFAGKWEVCLP